MQREAEQRIREMQSRARLVGGMEENYNSGKSKNQIAHQKPAEQKSVLPFLEGADSDKLLILALLWVLWNEKADSKLLLALLYLLL